MTVSCPTLAGRVAVVTGGASGAGPAMCRTLATAGAAVAVIGPDKVALATVLPQIDGDGFRAIGIAADCLRSDAVQRTRRTVERALGPVDLLVALAPSVGADPPGSAVGQAGERADIASRLVATYLLARVFLPGMLDRGRGTILTAPELAVFARHLTRGLVGSGVRIAALHVPRPSSGTGPDPEDAFARAVLTEAHADHPDHANAATGRSTRSVA